MTQRLGPPYGWDTLPTGSRDAVRCFVTHVTETLHDNSVGVYLCGSLGRGCYHPAFSDVDLFVVTREGCGDDTIAKLAAHPLPLGLQVHAVGMTTEQLRCDEVPTPAEFSLQTESGGVHALVGRRVKGGRGDLLLVRQDTYDCDVSLSGPAVHEVILPVPWEALAASCDQLLPNIVPHFKNPSLMLCRVCYAFAHRTLCSKATAGEWAVETFGPEWRDLVMDSLRKYRNGLADNQGETPELKAFEKYCVGLMTRR